MPFIIVIALSGCLAQGPMFARPKIEPGSNPIIYVYRPCAFTGAAATTYVEVDGAEARGLKTCGYLEFQVASGPHKIQKVNKGFQSWGSPEPVVMIEATAGRIYYIRYSGTVNSVSFVAVSELDGRVEIAELHLSQ